jgi:hypothetical protein
MQFYDCVQELIMLKTFIGIMKAAFVQLGGIGPWSHATKAQIAIRRIVRSNNRHEVSGRTAQF